MLSAAMAHNLLLRGLKLIKQGFGTKTNEHRFWVEKKSTCEVCPKCATMCSKVYDHRDVNIVDEPLRDTAVRLKFRKRRFYCKSCKKPLTEQLNGIKKGARVTERYRGYVFNCCERFSNLSTVRKVARCSSGFVYKSYYEHLRRTRIRQERHWPHTLGVDEHFFKRNKDYGHRDFVTMPASLKDPTVKIYFGLERIDTPEQIERWRSYSASVDTLGGLRGLLTGLVGGVQINKLSLHLNKSNRFSAPRRHLNKSWLRSKLLK